MLKLIGSVMIFGSCAALGLNARRELRRRVAAADAMLLALRLMENEITARRTPMPEIIDLLAKNENAVVRQIFSGVRRRMRERSGLSLSYLWCAGMRAAQADAGLGREECGVLCDAANFLGRYDASEQKAAIDTALHRLQMLRELAFAELRDRGSLYRTCGIAAGLLAGIVVLTLVLSLTLKKDAPVIAFLLVLAAGVVLLLRLGEAAQSTMQRFSALLARGNLGAELYGPVLRVVGIAVLVRILAALCRDAGQSALAAKVELAGTVLAFGAALPLLEQVLTFLTEWTV